MTIEPIDTTLEGKLIRIGFHHLTGEWEGALFEFSKQEFQIFQYLSQWSTVQDHNPVSGELEDFSMTMYARKALYAYLRMLDVPFEEYPIMRSGRAAVRYFIKEEQS